MAFNSGSGAAAIGFNQNSGGYYITTGALTGFTRTIAEGSGSGGATTPVSVSNFTFGAAGTAPSTLLAASGKLIRDLGRHVVSAGRAFRKFQAVENSDSGVSGTDNGVNAGYYTFYLEVPKGGVGPNGATSFAPIAKFS